MSVMQRDFIDNFKRFPLRRFQKGEVILQAGNTPDTLYAIRQGFAKIDSINSRGEQQLIWIASRLDMIPAESLFRTRGNLQFYYSAMTDLEAYEIPKQAFLDLCKDSPALVYETARAMSEHYDDLLIRLRAVEQSSIHEKLVYTLHYIASRFSGEATVRLEEQGLHFTHQDIAQMIGATRETTAIELKRMKDEGIIEYDRNTFVIHTEKIEPLL